MNIQEIIPEQKEKLEGQLKKEELALGEIIFNNGQCQVLSQSVSRYELIISDEAKNEIAACRLDIEDDGNIIPFIKDKASGWDKNSYACLLQIESEIHLAGPKQHLEHKKYSREGMIKRVLAERDRCLLANSLVFSQIL